MMSSCQYNTDDRPLPNKFVSIQTVPASSFRSSFGNVPHVHKGSLGNVTSPTSDAGTPAGVPSGAFGSFSIGAPGWRGKK